MHDQKQGYEDIIIFPQYPLCSVDFQDMNWFLKNIPPLGYKWPTEFVWYISKCGEFLALYLLNYRWIIILVCWNDNCSARKTWVQLVFNNSYLSWYHKYCKLIWFVKNLQTSKVKLVSTKVIDCRITISIFISNSIRPLREEYKYWELLRKKI